MTKQTSSLTILMMAGGTGGHVYPALAIADRLKGKGCRILWLGTQRGLEADVVPKAGYPLFTLPTVGLRGKNFKSLLTAPFKLMWAFFRAIKIIRQTKPDLVMGMGGYASGPGGMAAWLMRIPLVIHEQNAVAGMTNKLLSKRAKRVLTAFPDAFPQGIPVMHIGNPLRHDIEQLLVQKPAYNQAQGSHGEMSHLRLLVLGGSLGAAVLNQRVPEALTLFEVDECPKVMHQTGKQHIHETQMRYRALGIHAEVVPYIQDMASAYRWADLVICRAGALTVAEVMAAGVPSIMVPYPHAVDDHQTKNAHYYAQRGAAILIPQSDLSARTLADTIRELQQNPGHRMRISENAQKNAMLDAAERITQECLKVCHEA